MQTNLTIGEKIMLARTRRGLNRTELGTEIYINRKLKKLDYPDGRLKKIELGIIPPENFLENELATIADVLEMPIEFFSNNEASENGTELNFHSDFIKFYPDITKYVQLLNATIQFDRKLCADILQKASEYMKEVDHL